MNGTLPAPSMAGNDVGMALIGGVDVSILDVMAPVDCEMQRKYEAMGLPDPVAFAALTALGAIPNPMAMLNAMMLRAQQRIDQEVQARAMFDGRAPSGVNASRPAAGITTASLPRAAPPGIALPPGKSFVEAFKEMEMQQESSNLQEQIGFAMPTEKPRPVGPSSGYAAQRIAPTTNQPTLEPAMVDATDSAEVEKLEERFAKQAKELAEHAKVAASLKSKDSVGGWTTLPTERGLKQAFATAEDDLAEPHDMPARPTVPLVTLSSLLTGIQGGPSDAPAVERPKIVEDPAEVQRLPEYLKPKEKEKEKKRKSKSRSRAKSKERKKDKKKRARSRSMVRWLDRSRSNSHTNTGQYIRATGCSSTVRWWDKKKGSSSSSESSKKKRKSPGRRKRSRSASSDRSKKRSRSRRKFTEAKKNASEPSAGDKPVAASRRPRQVAIRGHWAQFVHSGKAYYYNIATRTCTWERPDDLDAPAPTAKSSKGGSSDKIKATTGPTSTML
eukprot:TRINITY_DN25182_c0_g1_i1.p1 TRINITY_DN25182_c0_g1~~TRINITY_DN25182_c0_g1_i1.p1  ORF type:complete len:500 (+),score=90.07 TRINITY_DN25182_c0_g1_i1:64-1563(+)